MVAVSRFRLWPMQGTQHYCLQFCSFRDDGDIKHCIKLIYINYWTFFLLCGCFVEEPENISWKNWSYYAALFLEFLSEVTFLSLLEKPKTAFFLEFFAIFLNFFQKNCIIIRNFLKQIFYTVFFLLENAQTNGLLSLKFRTVSYWLWHSRVLIRRLMLLNHVEKPTSHFWTQRNNLKICTLVFYKPDLWSLIIKYIN